MLDRPQTTETAPKAETNLQTVPAPAEGSAACPVEKKGWVKGPLAMAVCCGTPLLLVATVSFFGLSLGAIASGALSLAAVLACPLGIWIMMRMIMNKR